jgi:hypothetical protein
VVEGGASGGDIGASEDMENEKTTQFSCVVVSRGEERITGAGEPGREVQGGRSERSREEGYAIGGLGMMGAYFRRET